MVRACSSWDPPVRRRTSSCQAIETPKVLAMPGAVRARLEDAVPLNRLADPVEVAQLIAYLVSDSAGYITGGSFVIDGGLSLGQINLGSRKVQPQ